MGEILIIRHGETEWNREEVFRGRADIGLSERGRQQVKLIAESLRKSPIEAIYTSPDSYCVASGSVQAVAVCGAGRRGVGVLGGKA